MKVQNIFLIASLLAGLSMSCGSQPNTGPYKWENDPEIGVINGRMVPRKCAAVGSLDPQTHRVFTLPSVGYMAVKVDLGKLDLDPKQVQPLTDQLIALSWGREALCLNVKQRAFAQPPDKQNQAAYQASWDKYVANTQKLSQFAMIAMTYKPSAVSPGAPKPGAAAKVPKPKETPASKEEAQKQLVDAVKKWLAAYGGSKKSTKKTAVTRGLEEAPAPPESTRAQLERLRNELIEKPVKPDSDFGL